MSQSRTSKTKPQGKVAVLVLGMHRSGTSMLAGALERLGCKGPKTPMRASEANPRGYFESIPLMLLNDEILATLGTRWDDWGRVDDGWQESPRFLEYRDRIAATLASEYGGASLIHVKDPRLCRLLPLWRKGLDMGGFAPACLLTHRNPVDVARSLESRKAEPIAPGTGLLIWLRHVLDAEAASRGLPRLFTSYPRLLADAGAVADRAEAAFGFAWPVQRQARAALLHDIIDPALRHHDTPVAAVLDNSAIPAAIRTTLRVLERWSETGEDAEGRATLDQVSAEFDTAAALMGGPVTGLAAHLRESQGRETALQSRNDALAGIEEQQAEAQARIGALEADLTRLQASLTERDGTIAGRDGMIAERDGTIAGLQAAVQAAETAQRQALERVAQLRAEADLVAAELQARLETGQQRVAGLEAALRNAQGEQERQAREAAARQAGLETELGTLTAALVERDRNLIQQRNAARSAETQKAALERKLAEQAGQLERARAEHAAALEQTHAEYRRSTSWRFSAPVRVLGRLIKHR